MCPGLSYLRTLDHALPLAWTSFLHFSPPIQVLKDSVKNFPGGSISNLLQGPMWLLPSELTGHFVNLTSEAASTVATPVTSSETVSQLLPCFVSLLVLSFISPPPIQCKFCRVETCPALESACTKPPVSVCLLLQWVDILFL